MTEIFKCGSAYKHGCKRAATLSIGFAVFFVLTLTSNSGCGGSGDRVVDSGETYSKPKTVSAEVKKRLEIAAKNGLTDRELIVLLHPEILPYTLTDEDASGNVIPPDEYADRMGDEMAYFNELYKVVLPAPTDSPSYQVKVAVSGNSIKVLINGQEETIRLIGLDVPKKCGESEALDWLASYINGKTVTLEPEPALGDRDEAGRLLRYVWLNERDIGMQMLGEGMIYVNEGAAQKPYKYQPLYRRAQKIAQNSDDGIWNPKGCGGQG